MPSRIPELRQRILGLLSILGRKFSGEYSTAPTTTYLFENLALLQEDLGRLQTLTLTLHESYLAAGRADVKTATALAISLAVRLFQDAQFIDAQHTRKAGPHQAPYICTDEGVADARKVLSGLLAGIRKLPDV